MRNYELTYIVKPDLDNANRAAALERINELIAADGGSVLSSKEWGMRKLGYPIGKFKEGFYMHLLCQLTPAAVKQLDNRLKLNADLIRHLFVQEEHIRPVRRGVKKVVDVLSEELMVSPDLIPPADEDIIVEAE
ncbi:MAG: 30S ribosomal protein S6 [Chloroflexota bacterium]|jgi:small subunit ribosomal protein S6|nr:30S ribosomal protein S6 [Chloroflexota bacterium]